jgi:hypothetical protein
MTDYTEIDQALTAAGLTMKAVFVPQSKSRHAIKVRADKSPGEGGYCGKGEPCINWKCTVSVNGLEAWTGDYSQGPLHLPEFIRHKGSRNSVANYGAEIFACESGKAVRFGAAISGKGQPLKPPSMRDVLYGLLMDSEAYSMGFEEWADKFGYNLDSRKAEATYNECAAIGRALAARLSPAEIDRLREVFQDY